MTLATRDHPCRDFGWAAGAGGPSKAGDSAGPIRDFAKKPFPPGTDRIVVESEAPMIFRPSRKLATSPFELGPELNEVLLSAIAGGTKDKHTTPRSAFMSLTDSLKS